MLECIAQVMASPDELMELSDEPHVSGTISAAQAMGSVTVVALVPPLPARTLKKTISPHVADRPALRATVANSGDPFGCVSHG